MCKLILPDFQCSFYFGETTVINEFIKIDIHRGKRSQVNFWQDSQGKEIDCLLVEGEKSLPVEIKSGKTMNNSYFANLKYWRDLAKMPDDWGYVVYGGKESLETSTGPFVSWQDLELIKNP